jgi:deoxycytidylate deaminase
MPEELPPQPKPSSDRDSEESPLVALEDQSQAGSGSQKTDYLPELVLGFIAPSGIDREMVLRAVRERLSVYDYLASEIHLSSWLAEIAAIKPDWPTERRIPALQKVGDLVRSCSEHPEAMAQQAILEITRERDELFQKAHPTPPPRDCVPCRHCRATETPPILNRAYIVWSLKHEKEIELLRQVYRSRCFIFSVHAPEADRIAALEQKILIDRKGKSAKTTARQEAEQIVERDEHEALEGDYGQDVRNAYPLADFFVDGRDRTQLEVSVFRAIDIIFGAPFATPTKDEYGMYVAHAAALRSAELGRQVGASIATNLGDIVATGTNEVPIFGGGHYWTDPSNPTSSLDNREYKRGADTSDITKQELTSQVIKALEQSGALELTTDAAYDSVSQVLAGTRLADITEFGRAVHGEMSALMDAARRGISVIGLTMYVTTFPCHQCSRHIVTAGLARLVFIYPYAKSLASTLHGDSIETPGAPKLDTPRICYENYLGVAPRRYPAVFAMDVRKEKGVAISEFNQDSGKKRIPRLPDEGRNGIWDVLDYMEREAKTISVSTEWFRNITSSVPLAIKKQGGELWLNPAKKRTGGYKKPQPGLFRAGLHGSRIQPRSR